MVFSEQQAAEDAADHNHDGRCKPCVRQGVLLMITQILTGQAQQEEGRTGQRTQGETKGHLTHDGSLRHGQSVSAHRRYCVCNDRHDAVVIGIRIKQQAQRHAEQADDRRDKGSHAGGDDGHQCVRHSGQHTGVLDDAGERTSCEDDGYHQERGLCMAVDDLMLEFHAWIVDDEQDAVADHEGDRRAEPVGDQDIQDDDDQRDVEVPTPAAACQLVRAGRRFRLGQAGDDLCRDACGDTLRLFFAEESGNCSTCHPACDPRRHDADPQVTARDLIAKSGHCRCRTDGRAAPRHDVHDTCGQRNDGRFDPEVHLELLEQGHTGRDGNQEGGCTGTVEVADAADEEGADANLDRVFAGKFQNTADDGVKHTCIRAGAEEQNRKDEHNAGRDDAAQALAHVVGTQHGECFGEAYSKRDGRLHIGGACFFRRCLCRRNNGGRRVHKGCDKAGDGRNKDQGHKGRDLFAHDESQHQQYCNKT